jgi:hypothetical protein
LEERGRSDGVDEGDPGGVTAAWTDVLAMSEEASIKTLG